MLSSLAHSSLKKIVVIEWISLLLKITWGLALFLTAVFLAGRFAQSCSTHPSQRSKYTEGVALRMRICIAVQRLSRNCVQKKYALLDACRVKVALCHTYITSPQVTSRIAGGMPHLTKLWSRLPLTKPLYCNLPSTSPLRHGILTQKEGKNPIPGPSPNLNPNCNTRP